MDSLYLDLAIGLAVAFFLLSLLASGVNELIVRVLGVRAKFLWASLRDLLDKPPVDRRARTPLGGLLGLIRFAVRVDERPGFGHFPAVARPDPAEALDDLTERVHERLRGVDIGSRKLSTRAGWQRSDEGRKTNISQVPPDRFATAVLEVVTREFGGDHGRFATALEQGGSPFAAPLRALLAETTVPDAAGGDRTDVARLRQRIEAWFDSEMIRLTAVYRRHVRWVVGLIAVAATWFVGFDAVQYTDSLLDDQARREQMVALASSGDPAELGEVCGAILDRDRAETAEGEQEPAGDGDPLACFTTIIGEPALSDAFATSLIRVQAEDGQPQVRWNGSAWWAQVSDPGRYPGFLLTVVALLFGAPFWWEALRRLLGMRTRRPTTTDQ